MSFELPELFINKEFTWGPPDTEMTIDGQPFELCFKATPLEPFDWFRGTKRQEEREAEAAAAADAGGPAVLRKNRGQFITVKDESRVNALKNERAKTSFKPRYRKTTNNNNNNPRWRNKKMNRQIDELDNTVAITPDTVVYHEYQQSEMYKVRIDRMPTVVDIGLYGQPLVYNTALDKSSCAQPQPLNENDLHPDFYTRSTTLEDPVLREIIKSERGSHTRIVTTDEVLSLLMTSYRSINPWHIDVLRFQNIIFLSKGVEGNVEMQWVSETAPRAVRPSEDDPKPADRISSLGKESTVAQEAFIRAACSRTRGKVKANPNPFPKTQPRLYRYRRFTMHPDTPDRYDIIVRCEVDAVNQSNEYMRLFGLLEQRVPEKESEWRKGLDINRAAFIPSEFRLNSCKMSRWTALATLSGAQQMAIGFLARTNKPSDAKVSVPGDHQILSVLTNNPLSFATQMGVSINSMWAVLDLILQPIFALRDTNEAVLMKPSDHAELRLVEKPEDSDDDDDEEEEDEEEDEDDE